MMLIFIVVVFIICHSIRSIINTYECIQLATYGQLKHWPDWIQTLVHVNHFALVVNSSINILIYCVKDEKFRNVMWKTLGLTRFFKSNEGGQTNTNTVANHTNTATTAVSLSNNGKSTTEKCIRNGTTVSPRINGGGKSADTEKQELQTIVISSTTATNMETTVTTALLTSSDTMSAQSLAENKSE